MNLVICIPFIIVFILHIVFLMKHNQRGSYVTKPLLMPLLLLLYVFNVDNPNYLLVGALAASFLGDVFLMGSGKGLVLGGIGAFLLSHVFYIIVFSHFLSGVPLWFFLVLLLYIGIGIIIGRKLFPSMDSMKFPAMLYMGVILLMSFTSFTRIWSVSFTSFFLPFIGSILFLISDTMLAFDMFTDKRMSNHAWIMITYILAQCLIILGFIF